MYLTGGFILLVVLRPLGTFLLYDPLELYFQNDYLNLPLPEMNLLLLGLSVSLKYLMNSAVSLGIIYAAFYNVEYSRFALKIYFWVYLILIFLFFLLMLLEPQNSTRLLFYIRRFLMHPLLVLVLIPAFYYQQLNSKKN